MTYLKISKSDIYHFCFSRNNISRIPLYMKNFYSVEVTDTKSHDLPL